MDIPPEEPDGAGKFSRVKAIHVHGAHVKEHQHVPFLAQLLPKHEPPFTASFHLWCVGVDGCSGGEQEGRAMAYGEATSPCMYQGQVWQKRWSQPRRQGHRGTRAHVHRATENTWARSCNGQARACHCVHTTSSSVIGGSVSIVMCSKPNVARARRRRVAFEMLYTGGLVVAWVGGSSGECGNGAFPSTGWVSWTRAPVPAARAASPPPLPPPRPPWPPWPPADATSSRAVLRPDCWVF